MAASIHWMREFLEPKCWDREWYMHESISQSDDEQNEIQTTKWDIAAL